MPEITVIVPVYNSSQYLEKCLDSLRNQTFSDTEILLIDDGSKDDSPSICKKYVEKCENFHYYHKKNGGPSDARNMGISLAKGNFLAFVDSDDYVEPDFLFKLWKCSICYEADIVCCGYFFERNNERKSKVYFKTGSISQEEFWRSILKGEEIGNYMCNKLFRISLFQGIKFPSGRLYEDMFVMRYIMEKSGTVAVISEPLYHYVYRKHSITANYNRKNAHDLMEAWGAIYSYINKNFPALRGEYKISRMKQTIILTNSLSKLKIGPEEELWSQARKYIIDHWEDSKKVGTKLRISALLIRIAPAFYAKLLYGRCIIQKNLLR